MLVISGRMCPREKLSVCVSFLSPNKICDGNSLSPKLSKVVGIPDNYMFVRQADIQRNIKISEGTMSCELAHGTSIFSSRIPITV